LRRRRLATELRRLRERAGLTLEQAAEHSDLTKSTLSRMETAQIGSRPVVVRVLLSLYGTPGTEVEALLQLARDARRRGWWQAYSDVLTSQYADYISIEAEALAIRNYEPLFIPGLLQTEAYTREIITSAVTDMSDAEIDRRVGVRMARQRRLTESPCLDLWAIMDEAVLRRPTGTPATMQGQYKQLLEAGRLSNVTIQVLPLNVGAHPGMTGSFSVVESPEPTFPDIVYVDTVAGELYLESEVEARRVNMLFNHLRARALDPERSTALIAGLADGVTL
jgi:transcriptional regulator with XRE-family HTH domain